MSLQLKETNWDLKNTSFKHEFTRLLKYDANKATTFAWNILSGSWQVRIVKHHFLKFPKFTYHFSLVATLFFWSSLVFEAETKWHYWQTSSIMFPSRNSGLCFNLFRANSYHNWAYTFMLCTRSMWRLNANDAACYQDITHTGHYFKNPVVIRIWFPINKSLSWSNKS